MGATRATLPQVAVEREDDSCLGRRRRITWKKGKRGKKEGRWDRSSGVKILAVRIKVGLARGGGGKRPERWDLKKKGGRKGGSKWRLNFAI